MSLSILSNPASLAAENQLNVTNNALQKTLYQLSSGQRINSGADDAAGLAIANGLEANISALTQSTANANDGVGALQVADGALSQVTTLLNRAVTLATESATSTVTDPQRKAIQAEYQQIQDEIDQIGSNTNYNGGGVFGQTESIYISDGTGSTTQSSNFIQVQTGTVSSASLLGGAPGQTLAVNALPSDGDNITIGGTTYTFKTALTTGQDATSGAVEVLIDTNANDSPSTQLANTLSNLAAAINAGPGAGTLYAADVNGPNPNADATAAASGNTVTLSATPTGVAVGGANIASTVGKGSEFNFLDGATFTTGGTPTDLSSATDAQAALGAINSAIAQVAQLRGGIGAGINRLQSASNVITTTTQNLTSAEDGIMAADIPSAVANLTKYSILEQTGISSLAQANQMQQLVLKLLQ
jgi:flagellin